MVYKLLMNCGAVVDDIKWTHIFITAILHVNIIEILLHNSNDKAKFNNKK